MSDMNKPPIHVLLLEVLGLALIAWMIAGPSTPVQPPELGKALQALARHIH